MRNKYKNTFIAEQKCGKLICMQYRENKIYKLTIV